MSIYSIDYTKVINNLLPPSYRLTKMKSWLNSLIYPLQWLRDIYFDSYINSNTLRYFDGVNTITPLYKGDLIRFKDNSVWMNLVYGTDILTDNPFHGNSYLWQYILTDSIGFLERLKFNNQKLKFEYLYIK